MNIFAFKSLCIVSNGFAAAPPAKALIIGVSTFFFFSKQTKTNNNDVFKKNQIRRIKIVFFLEEEKEGEELTNLKESTLSKEISNVIDDCTSFLKNCSNSLSVTD